MDNPGLMSYSVLNSSSSPIATEVRRQLRSPVTHDVSSPLENLAMECLLEATADTERYQHENQVIELICCCCALSAVLRLSDFPLLS